MVEAPRTLSPARRGRRAGSRLLLVLAGLAVGAQLYGLYTPSDGGRVVWFPGADKIQHVLAFAVPVLLVVIARGAAGRVTSRFLVVTAAAFAAHAVVSELVQHTFYRSRTGDPYDVLADAVGIGLGLVGARAILTRPPRRREGRLAEAGG